MKIKITMNDCLSFPKKKTNLSWIKKGKKFNSKRDGKKIQFHLPHLENQ